MIDDLQQLRKKAEGFRESAFLFFETAEAIDRFCSVAERGDVEQAGIESEAAKNLQRKVEQRMAANVFRFEIKL